MAIAMAVVAQASAVPPVACRYHFPELPARAGLKISLSVPLSPSPLVPALRKRYIFARPAVSSAPSRRRGT